jgi:hypothetical protein
VIKVRRDACQTHRVWRVEAVAGPAMAGGPAGGAAFVLDGLWLGGPPPEARGRSGPIEFRGLELQVAGQFREVRLRHTTLVPARSRLALDNLRGCLSIEQSIVGGIITEAPAGRTGSPPEMHVTDSVLDSWPRGAAVVDGGTPRRGTAPTAFVHLTAARVTAFGPVRVYVLAAAQDSIFTGGLHVARTDLGCVRFCSLQLESIRDAVTPQRYECQPDLALIGAGLSAAHPAAAAVAASVAPRFTSRSYGAPGYAQLAAGCPPEVSGGAEDGSEMGAFHDLYQPQRTALLQERLEEYTPAGSDARLTFVT